MPDITDQDVLAFLKLKGPQVSNDIRKNLKTDSFIVGAILSSLLAKQSVKVTHVKKGSSPLYYLPGQEAILEKFIELHNAKDQRVIEMLRSEQVLRDRDLELLYRVGLRQVKDFAKELKAQVPGGTILFWRYYLLTEAQAIELIKQKYWHVKREEPKVAPKPVEQTKEQPTPVQEQKPDIPVVEDEPKQVPPPTPMAQKSAPAKPGASKPITSKPIEKTTSAQKTLSSEVRPVTGSPFYDEVASYFDKQKIIIEQQEIIAKDREFGFVITVPSAVGELKMYCRARNKKKLNEGDVAPSLLKAKQLDLPCLFLTNGSFTKKSLSTIEKEYSGVLLQYLE